PQTYEDQAEADFLVSLFAGRTGALENTVFCLLGPDGEERLSRSGRTPAWEFRDAETMAKALDRRFERFAEKAKSLAALPLHDDLSLGLNVAACDLRPLVVLKSPDEFTMAALEKRVAKLAWQDDHIGRQHYLKIVGESKDDRFKDLQLADGLSVLEATPFGAGGRVLAQAGLKASTKELDETLTSGRARHAPAPKSRRQHMREGRLQGIKWESEIPVTDPEDLRRAKAGRTRKL
ncbi:MAG: hypothetical protein KDB18_12210, partial [Salinibacterium sp.]|nr:hypothetical protein [Salinibacterium sp.]